MRRRARRSWPDAEGVHCRARPGAGTRVHTGLSVWRRRGGRRSVGGRRGRSWLRVRGGEWSCEGARDALGVLAYKMRPKRVVAGWLAGWKTENECGRNWAEHEERERKQRRMQFVLVIAIEQRLKLFSSSDACACPACQAPSADCGGAMHSLSQPHFNVLMSSMFIPTAIRSSA